MPELLIVPYAADQVTGPANPLVVNLITSFTPNVLVDGVIAGAATGMAFTSLDAAEEPLTFVALTVK